MENIILCKSTQFVSAIKDTYLLLFKHWYTLVVYIDENHVELHKNHDRVHISIMNSIID